MIDSYILMWIKIWGPFCLMCILGVAMIYFFFTGNDFLFYASGGGVFLIEILSKIRKKDAD